MYRPESGIAEEFIDDQEIKDTLAYADANKNNKELILSIIEKAKKLKGISHREASVLLACEDKELIQKVFDLAIKIKEEFYGNRIVMFAPLYLANYCVNGCTYCPYHYKNKHIRRKKLTQEEIKKEVIALKKEWEKLEKNLGGIKEMKKIPDAIFIVDPKKERICVQEAHTLGIPLIGIADTNCDPEELDYVIPGNDDAIRAVKLIVSKMADAVIEANQGEAEEVYEGEDVETAEETTEE
mgnify:CR=1 FL=1